MAHVFISYVRENSGVVDRLAEELRDRGVIVWLDRNNIEPGARWKDAIKKAIQSGKFFIACFSREYNERTKTHMLEELTIAIDQLRYRPSEKNWFIPVMLNETHIHSRRISGVEDLSDIQSIKLYEDWDANFNRILRVIKYDNKQFAHMSNLIDIIEKPFTGERLYAMRELRTMGAAAKSAVSVLIKASTENNAEIKKSSIETLGQIGPDAADAAPALAAALNDPDKDVRLSATMALGKIGPNAAEAVPAIIAALKDPDKEIRLSAAVALGEIGPAAVEAVPALVAALKSPRALIPRFAAIALRKIGPPLQKS